jgi:hypothetical protein
MKTTIDMYKMINSNSKYFDQIIIKNDHNNIVSLIDSHGIIQLREYNSEDTLILGCGNYPTDNRSYFRHEDHHHENCYTIDEDIYMNPSIVGSFGIDCMKFLGKELFSKIHFEGFMLECFKYKDQKINEELLEKNKISYVGSFLSNYYKYKDTDYVETENKCTISNILHLLKEDGIIYFNNLPKYIKKDNKLISTENPNVFVSTDSKEDFYIFTEAHKNIG